MANNAVLQGKVAGKGRGGRGGSRRGSGRSARGGGYDDTSDEEYVLEDDGGEEEETESSDGSYSSDASKDVVLNDDGEQEEEFDLVHELGIKVSKGRRTRRRRPTADFLAAAVATDAPWTRKPRVVLRRGPVVFVDEEGEECDDANDEDFAPDEDEEEEEEEIAVAPSRSAGCRNSNPGKVQRRRGRRRNSTAGEKRTSAPASKKKKKKRTRLAMPSDDDDFVVRDRRRFSSDATAWEKKTTRGRTLTGRKRRRSWASRSDRSESDSSDLDYGVSDVESRNLGLRRLISSFDVNGDKGKGQDDRNMGKHVCGICLSEEKKGLLRGLLDCCVHYFCFDCIMEWSKVESRCPLCKRRFRTVRKTATLDAGFSLRTAVISIPERDQVYLPSEEEIRSYIDPYANVVCVECHRDNDDSLMLLCDICDSPAHTYCVGLGREVPEGNWYCDACRAVDLGSSNFQVQESTVGNGVTSGVLHVNPHYQVDSESTPVHMLREPSHQLSSLSCQLPSDRIGEDTSRRHMSALGDHECASQAPGFTAATVSGRRSIHHYIRIMISNNRGRWVPEGVAESSMIPHPIGGSGVLSTAVEQHGEHLCLHQQNLPKEMDERDPEPFLRSRISMLPCMNADGRIHDMKESAKELS